MFPSRITKSRVYSGKHNHFSVVNAIGRSVQLHKSILVAVDFNGQTDGKTG